MARRRVFLAGDAAHLMPPFAGQGMNGGMKDAVNLAWKLAAVLTGQASEDILDTYEIERAPVVTRMVERVASPRLGHHADEQVRRGRARRALRLSQSLGPLPRLHRPRRDRSAPRHPSQRLDRERERRADRPDGASADSEIFARRKLSSTGSLPATNGSRSDSRPIPSPCCRNATSRSSTP